MQASCYHCGDQPVWLRIWCQSCWSLPETRTPEAYAELYAAASLLYYGHEVSIMDDHNFDGLCHYLLTVRGPKWLDRNQLRAGSGFDSAGFPAKVKEWVDANWRSLAG